MDVIFKDIPDIFFTSDTHFGHTNVIKYSNRPFKSVQEMDENLIDNWNETVKQSDTVYHLGDFSFYDEERIVAILKRLNGNKTFLKGNHDKKIWRSSEAKNIFKEMLEYKEIYVQDRDAVGGKRMIVMCHYPMITWNKCHHGAYMLHGHCHHNLKYPFPARIMDVGVDGKGYDYSPVSYEQVKAHMKNVVPVFPDHHSERDEE